jgi:hypothetical protein
MLILRSSLRPVSGKTTVANIYHDFLIESKVIRLDRNYAEVSAVYVPRFPHDNLLLGHSILVLIRVAFSAPSMG